MAKCSQRDHTIAHYAAVGNSEDGNALAVIGWNSMIERKGAKR
jgi:hypothetical protein